MVDSAGGARRADTGPTSAGSGRDGRLEAYALVGPSATEGGLPAFGSSLELWSSVWHEFAHTLIDPLTAKHREVVMEHSSLYDPIAAEMDEMGYGSWETVVNEHVIRAGEARLAHERFGPVAAREKLREEARRGVRPDRRRVGQLESPRAVSPRGDAGPADRRQGRSFVVSGLRRSASVPTSVVVYRSMTARASSSACSVGVASSSTSSASPRSFR